MKEKEGKRRGEEEMRSEVGEEIKRKVCFTSLDVSSYTYIGVWKREVRKEMKEGGEVREEDGGKEGRRGVKEGEKERRSGGDGGGKGGRERRREGEEGREGEWGGGGGGGGEGVRGGRGVGEEEGRGRGRRGRRSHEKCERREFMEDKHSCQFVDYTAPPPPLPPHNSIPPSPCSRFFSSCACS